MMRSCAKRPEGTNPTRFWCSASESWSAADAAARAGRMCNSGLARAPSRFLAVCIDVISGYGLVSQHTPMVVWGR